MAALASCGYQTVSLAALLDWLLHSQPLPEKAVLITFDDGYESVYQEAWPHLRARGFGFTVFLITDYCGRDNQWAGQPASVPVQALMSWQQVADLAAEGCEFGAHTRSHPPLPRLQAAQIEQELLGSKQQIEAQIGQKVRFFAAPYGATNVQVNHLIKRHFEGAVGTRLGVVRPKSNPYTLARIDAYYLTPSMISWFDHPAFHAYLYLRERSRTIRRWRHMDYGS